MSADTNETPEGEDSAPRAAARPKSPVTMSNISINLCYSNEAPWRRPPRGNRGRHVGLQHRVQPWQHRGFPGGPHPGSHRHEPPLRRNGDFTPGAGFPPSTSAASTATRQPAAAAQWPSPSPGPKPPPTAAARQPSPSCSHKPAAAQTSPAGIPSKYLALDCEMVGTGPKGSISHLGRCSLVSYEGDVVYDKFIKPTVPVTDYRTRWSGIRRCDLVNATPYAEARREILRLLMGKVVIGHAIHNDFKVLGYSHPAALTRDTSRIPPLNLRAGFAVAECASLKRLTKAILNRDIQTGKKGHSSVEDAKATMELYRVVEAEWERKLASRSQAC